MADSAFDLKPSATALKPSAVSGGNTAFDLKPSVTPAPAPKKSALPKPQDEPFFSDARSPVLNSIVEGIANAPRLLESTPDQNIVSRVASPIAKAVTGLVGFPAQVVSTVNDAATQNSEASQKAMHEGRVLDAIGSAIAQTPPGLILQAADKLLFQPGRDMRAKADAMDIQAANDPSNAQGLTSGANTMRRLSILPFAGPAIAEDANKIAEHDTAGGLTDIAAQALMMGLGAQGKGEAQLKAARTAAINELADAHLQATTQQGLPFNKPELVNSLKTVSTQDILDTAKAQREANAQSVAKAQALSDAKSRMAQGIPEQPATDVQPNITEPVIKPKVVESYPAIPASELKVAEKQAAKVHNVQTPQDGIPTEGSPAPALISDEERAHLEQKGFTVDSQGRLARLVQSRPSNPEAGQAALEPSVISDSQTASVTPDVKPVPDLSTIVPELRTPDTVPGNNPTPESVAALKAKNGIAGIPSDKVGEPVKRVSTAKQDIVLKSNEQLTGQAGKQTSVETPSGSIPGQYKLVEAGNLITSHDPHNFAKNANYPEGVQERAYHTSKEAQNRVIQQAQDYKPNYTVNTNPDAVNGPPVVTQDGIVLGGNSRAMSTARLYKSGNAEAYKSAIRDQAAQFGLDPAAVAQMKNPVLVREVATPKTIEEARRVGSQLNKSMTGALGVSEKAVSAGKSITPDTLGRISGMLEQIGGDASLRDVFRERPREIVDMLVKDGVITERERPQFVDTSTGGLSEEGKGFVEKALLGSVVDDPVLMDRTPKTILNKLDGSLGDLSQVGGRGDEYNILPIIREALEEHADIAARGSDVEMHLSQNSMFGGTRNPIVDALVRALADKSKKVREGFRSFTQDANVDKPNQGMLLLGDKPSAAKAFNHAFGTNFTDSQFADHLEGVLKSQSERTKLGDAHEGRLQQGQDANESVRGNPATEPPSGTAGGVQSSGLKTNLLKKRNTPETGAVRPDLLVGAPAEVIAEAAKKVGEVASEGRGIAAAIGSEQKTNEPLPKYAGSINLEKLNTPDEVKRQVLSTYEANKPAIDKARKVGRSFEQVQKDALDLGWDSNTVKKSKGALTDAQITAARQITLGINEEVAKLRKDYTADPSPKNLIAVQEALSRSAAVNQAMQGASAEAGRALNAHKILAQALRESQTDMQKALETVRKQLGDKWEENQKAVLDTLAQIPEGDTRRLNQFIRKYAQFTTKDKIYAYYLANILSGVQTNVKNFIGNVSMVPLETATKVIRGIGNKEAYSSEAAYSLAGRWQGLSQGFEAAFHIMRDGMNAQEAAKLEIPQRYEFTGLAKAWNYPGRLLEASDAIFKSTAMNGELRALAARQGMKEGLKGQALDSRINQIMANPPEEMVNAAVKQARYETFTQDPGAWTKAIIDARGKVEPMKYVIPFINVPTNLLKTGMEYSPAGFLKAPREIIMGKLKGDEVRANYLKTPEARDAFARATIGTAVSLYAWQKYQEGGLTGKAPTDPAKRDAFLRTRQEYSVKLGGKWVRYTDFGPLAIPFLMTAAVEDARQIHKNFPVEDVATEAIGSMARGIFAQSFLKGLNDLGDTFGAGTGSFGDAVKKQAAGSASGFVPFSGALRSAKNVLDPLLRQPDKMYERIMAGLPILSESVPSKLNALGDETKNSRLNGILGFGMRDTKVPNLSIEKEMAKSGFTPSVPDTSIKVGGQDFPLDRDHRRELTDFYGQARKQLFEQLISDQYPVTLGTGSDKETLTYSQMDAEQRQKAFNHVDNEAKSAAKEEFINRVNSRKEEMKPKPKKALLQFVGAE